jgi:hypothetical protein
MSPPLAPCMSFTEWSTQPVKYLFFIVIMIQLEDTNLDLEQIMI